jgi:helicase MOV-10
MHLLTRHGDRPGTGKTSTLIEAILQLLSRGDTRILLCAPNGAATDMLTSRLAVANLTSADTLRLATTYSVAKPYSDTSDDDMSALPSLVEVLRARIVISTCLAAGVLQTLYVPRDHFTHIFIDDAGCANEPTATIPIRAVAGPKTNVILAGDLNQLSPAVQSQPAADAGLSVSYFQRLLDIKGVYGVGVQAPGRRSYVARLLSGWHYSIADVLIMQDCAAHDEPPLEPRHTFLRMSGRPFLRRDPARTCPSRCR